MKSNKVIVWVVSLALIMTMVIPGTLALSAKATSSSNEITTDVESVNKETSEQGNSGLKTLSAAKNSKECTCGTETDIHDADCPLYTEPADGAQDVALSETAQAYMDKINDVKSDLASLDPEAEDYQDQLETISAKLSNINEEAYNAFEEGVITEAEYTAIYLAIDEIINNAIGGADQWEVLGNIRVVCSSITNAEVAYITFDSNTDTTNPQFKTAAKGETVSLNASDGVLLFFVKPDANHLLTEMTLKWNNQTNNVDLYSTNVTAANSNIYYMQTNSTRGQAILDAAKAKGYVGYFGYTMEYANATQYLTVKAEKPGMEVVVTADPNKDLKPGDEIKYTVTITPEKIISSAKVEDVSLEELYLNGTKMDVDKLTLTKNSDGTYTVEIPHTVTTEEWKSSSAEIKVKAKTKYSYSLNLSDTTGTSSTAKTSAEVEGEATAKCTLATAKGVMYELRYDAPDGIMPPDDIPPAPTDEKEYFKDDTVIIKDYTRAEVDDPTNNGTWKFSGWYVGDDRENAYDKDDTLTMDDNNILLVGIWKFEKYPYADLKIVKTGCQDIDENQSFVFTITGADNKTKDINNTVIIHGNRKVVLKDLPLGSYTITEDTNWSWRYTPDSAEKTVKITSSSKGDNIVTVEFNNKRTENKWLNGSSWCRNLFKDGAITQTRTTTNTDKN